MIGAWHVIPLPASFSVSKQRRKRDCYTFSFLCFAGDEKIRGSSTAVGVERLRRATTTAGRRVEAEGSGVDGSGAGQSLKEAGFFWTLLMIISFMFQAADTVLKEIIFLDAAQKLKGGSMDLFVVNSYGSAFQALFICLLLPFLSKLWGVPFNQLPNYLKDGAACFLNIGSLSSGCDGAPLLPLLFVLVNMAFNISLLHLLKISSAVVSCLATTFSVPLSVYVFTLPLPYIGIASSLPAGFIMGVIILLIGMLLYTWTPPDSTTTSTVALS